MHYNVLKGYETSVYYLNNLKDGKLMPNTHSTLGLKVRLAPIGIVIPIVILKCEKGKNNVNSRLTAPLFQQLISLRSEIVNPS